MQATHLSVKLQICSLLLLWGWRGRECNMCVYLCFILSTLGYKVTLPSIFECESNFLILSSIYSPSQTTCQWPQTIALRSKTRSKEPKKKSHISVASVCDNEVNVPSGIRYGATLIRKTNRYPNSPSPATSHFHLCLFPPPPSLSRCLLRLAGCFSG